MISVGRSTSAITFAIGERLARAGDAEQDLRLVAALEPLDQLADRLGLIAGRRERRLRAETAPVRCGTAEAAHPSFASRLAFLPR